MDNTLPDTLLDPACGAAGLLFDSVARVELHDLGSDEYLGQVECISDDLTHRSVCVDTECRRMP